VSGPNDIKAASLYSRNLQAFARAHPHVLRSLSGNGGQGGQVVYQGGEAVNLKVAGVELYPEAAKSYVTKQVAAYLSSPDRLKIPDPLDDSQPSLTFRLAEELDRFAQENGIGISEDFPVSDVGIAFVFGLGLGYHIPMLLEQCRAEQMVVVEPVPEFVKHSMYALDWEKVFKQAEHQGTALHFKIGLTPERFMLEAEALIIHSGAARFIDGTFAFIHYPSWQVIECRKILNERIGNFLIRPGHFGDEKMMMENAVDNLATGSVRLLEGSNSATRDETVFIVGSGPSLDNDLKDIAKLRKGALVVSCGSSLGVLLKNGIRPDFHIENENSYPLVQNLKTFQDEFGFEGITLIASATVNREASEMFERVWYYFRSTLSPAHVLASKWEPVAYAGPLVANAALAAMSSLGFKRFVMFGVDCGRVQGGLHHSKDAVYYEKGYDNFIEGEGHEYLEGEFTRLVPGNFGGEIATSAYYDLSRRTITELIRTKNLDVTNCSWGARVDGAKSLASNTLDFQICDISQKTLISELEMSLRYFTPAEFLRDTDFDGHIEACDALYDALHNSISTNPPQEYIALQRQVEAVLGEGGDKFRGVVRLVHGSLLSLARLGTYRGSRIASDKDRTAYFCFFLGRFDVLAGEIFKEAQAFLRQIKKTASRSDV